MADLAADRQLNRIPATTDRPAARQTLDGHLPVLDGVRGFAILLVVFYHLTLVNPEGSALERLLQAVFRNFGWCGVDLFFVLSGFLITGLLYEAKSRPQYFRNFYARRVLRIFPLYYAYLLVVLVVAPLVHPAINAYLRVGDDSIWYWLYLQNYAIAAAGDWSHSQFLNHLWSLAIEEQFYMVWPVVVLLCNRRALMIVCAAMVIVSLGLRLQLLADGVSPLAIYVMTPTRLDALALGGWAAMALRGPGGIAPLITPAKIAAVMFGLLTLALCWRQGSFAYHLPLTACIGLTLLAVLFAAVLILVLVAAPDGIAGRLFASTTLGMFGRYSYALYIFHQPVITVVNRVLARLFPSASPLQFQMLLIVVALPLAVALSGLSWHLFEKHFLKLKRYFASAPAVPVEALSTPTATG